MHGHVAASVCACACVRAYSDKKELSLLEYKKWLMFIFSIEQYTVVPLRILHWDYVESAVIILLSFVSHIACGCENLFGLAFGGCWGMLLTRHFLNEWQRSCSCSIASLMEACCSGIWAYVGSRQIQIENYWDSDNLDLTLVALPNKVV